MPHSSVAWALSLTLLGACSGAKPGTGGPGTGGTGAGPVGPTAPTGPIGSSGGALCVTSDPAPAPLRRLTRAEYNNTVRDLTGLDLRPADKFPPDELTA